MNLETWIVTNDGSHNAFTDLLYWHEYFWLIYVSSPSHFKNSASRLVLLNSKDARIWKEVKIFYGWQPGEKKQNNPEIRDPKLVVFQERLFVFALLNERFDPEPYQTVAASSIDGFTWTEFSMILPAGWLLGHPVTGIDRKKVFAAAHRIDQGTAALFTSADGMTWIKCSTIFEGNKTNPDRADETAIQFSENGELIAVTRLESGSSLFGSDQACTLISASVSPYDKWNFAIKNYQTRLDGPVLFNVRGNLFAVGRRQVNKKKPFQGLGSAFTRKRTSLFMLDLPKIGSDTNQPALSRPLDNASCLLHICDFPSSGDTSYAGAVVKDGILYISYYSNDPDQDDPWLLGMFRPTRIQITAIKIEELPN